MYNPYFGTCAAFPADYGNDFDDDDYGYGFGYTTPYAYPAMMPPAVMSPTIVRGVGYGYDDCTDYGNYNTYRSLYTPGAYGGYFGCGGFGYDGFYDDDDSDDEDEDAVLHYNYNTGAGYPFRRRSM